MLLTGIVELPCKLVIAAWASGCELNFTNAQPARRIKEEIELNKNCRKKKFIQCTYSTEYHHNVHHIESDIYSTLTYMGEKRKEKLKHSPSNDIF